MRFFEVDNPADEIVAAAMMIQQRADAQGKQARLSMDGFLSMMQNAGITMDYAGFKSIFDSNPQLQNVIDDFNKDRITFKKTDADDSDVGYEEPQTDMPDDERVAKMAKSAMRTREFVEGKHGDIVDQIVDMQPESGNEIIRMARRLGAQEEAIDDIYQDVLDRIGTLDEGKMNDLAQEVERVYKTMQRDDKLAHLADEFKDDVSATYNIRRSLNNVLPASMKRAYLDALARDGKMSENDRMDRFFGTGKYASELDQYFGKNVDPSDVIKKIGPQKSGGKKVGKRSDSVPVLDFDYFGQNESMEYNYGASIVNSLERIVDKKQADEIKFFDGRGKVDMYTASMFMNVYNKVNDDNKKKMMKMIETRNGFINLMKKLFSMKTESIREGMEDKIKKDIKIKWDMHKNNESVQERSLTKDEKNKMKSYEKKIDKADFIERYGKKEGEAIYYGTITNMAKKNA